MALAGMNFFGIRPPAVQKAISLSEKQTAKKLFIIDPLTKKCLTILSEIIKYAHKTDQLTELCSHMKKVLSYVFGKVSETVIKDKISNNLFYCKCLLLTNHSNKCKILM